MKIICEVLQWQVELSGKQDIMRRPERKEHISEVMYTNTTKTVFNR